MFFGGPNTSNPQGVWKPREPIDPNPVDPWIPGNGNFRSQTKGVAASFGRGGFLREKLVKIPVRHTQIQLKGDFQTIGLVSRGKQG